MSYSSGDNIPPPPPENDYYTPPPPPENGNYNPPRPPVYDPFSPPPVYDPFIPPPPPVYYPFNPPPPPVYYPFIPPPPPVYNPFIPVPAPEYDPYIPVPAPAPEYDYYIPSGSYSESSGGISAAKIAVPPVVVTLVVVAVSLVTYLVIRKRNKRKNAANDVESPKQPKGVTYLQTSPANAPSNQNIHLMSSPTPLLQQTLTSSPAPYHGFYDTGASGSSYNSGTSDYLQQQPPPISSNLKTSMPSKNTLTYEELKAATNGFSMDNLLGQGGFGFVFKGVINGRDVAVKKMKYGNGQGEREFQAEVETISRAHHRHLVSLVGYCIAEDQRLLVYEFVPNQTLEHHLHDKRLPTMEWFKRLKIALGSAKGLAYLHDDCYPKTIHRDIKTANILLDFNFDPKVADFGLAKQSSENFTHVSTRIMGTFGYMAPEYASSGKLTEKSDVFSFGVVLLELITGRRPVDTTQRYMDDSLVEWAKPLLHRSLEDDNYDEIVDPRLQPLGYDKNEMRRMVACAAACVRQSARQRPKISLIVNALEVDVSIDELYDGVKPGQSAIYSSNGSSCYGKTQYNIDMEKHRKLALTSEEFSTTEHAQSEFSIGFHSAEQRGR